MAEDREIRLKRLRLRSWRRGLKEMDLMFGTFADAEMANLNDAELDAHESLMAEHDQDLLVWFTGQQDVPEPLKMALLRVQQHYYGFNSIITGSTALLRVQQHYYGFNSIITGSTAFFSKKDLKF